MRRLGAVLGDCSECSAPFAIRRPPFHWIHVFYNGELILGDDLGVGIYCSANCAKAHIKRLTQETRPGHWDFLYFEDVGDGTGQYK